MLIKNPLSDEVFAMQGPVSISEKTSFRKIS